MGNAIIACKQTHTNTTHRQRDRHAHLVRSKKVANWPLSTAVKPLSQLFTPSLRIAFVAVWNKENNIQTALDGQKQEGNRLDYKIPITQF